MHLLGSRLPLLLTRDCRLPVTLRNEDSFIFDTAVTIGHNIRFRMKIN